MDGGVAVLPASGRVFKPLSQAPALGPGGIAYVDIATLHQKSLVELVEQVRIRSVVDARRCPVFGKPRFDHRYVVSFLHQAGVPYVEMVMLALRPRGERGTGIFRADETTARLTDAFARGTSLCLYDADAREHGWLEETRRLVRLAPGYACEIHPSALLPGRTLRARAR